MGRKIYKHFILIYFLEDINGSLEPVFNEIKEITETLIMDIKLYDINIKS